MLEGDLAVGYVGYIVRGEDEQSGDEGGAHVEQNEHLWSGGGRGLWGEGEGEGSGARAVGLRRDGTFSSSAFRKRLSGEKTRARVVTREKRKVAPSSSRWKLRGLVAASAHG